MEKLGLNHSNGIKRFINKTSNNLKLRIAIMQKDKSKVEKLWFGKRVLFDLKYDLEYDLELSEEQKETQMKFKKYFPSIIELFKGSEEDISIFWQYANDEIKEENSKLFPKIIEVVKNDHSNLSNVWKSTSDKIKDENYELFPSVIEQLKNNFNDLKYVWDSTSEKIKSQFPGIENKYYRFRADSLEKEANQFGYSIPEKWIVAEPEVQRLKPELLEYFIKNDIECGGYRINELWINTDYQVQRNNPETLNQIIEFADANTSGDYYLSSIFFSTDNQLLEQNERMMKINFSVIRERYEESSEEEQNIYFDKLLNLYSSNIDKIKGMWEATKPQIQKENLFLIIDMVKDNPRNFAEVWYRTVKEVQKEKLEIIIDMVKENLESIKAVWGSTDKEVQKENSKILSLIIDMVKENTGSIVEICRNTDHEIVSENFGKIYTSIYNNSELSEEFENRMKSIIKKNVNIFNTLNWDFLEIAQKENYTDEQILRITNYENVQDYLVQNSDNTYVKETINYLLENDTNWIISMDKIIKHKDKYNELLSNIKQNGEMEVTEEFIQQLITIISDTENYFDINNYEDVNNYYNKRNEICLKIFEGDFENIPPNLKNLDKDNLYKFALLEYKFGISLNNAKRIVERYVIDAKELPDGILKDYLILLKDIVKHKNIKVIIDKAKENETLNEPWLGFPNARNAEGKILNLYAELYNETLYQTNERDKNEKQETYIGEDRQKHKIDVYTLQDDFNINIRVEGAYAQFVEPENFVDYYNNPNIDNHGNCESYVGNDQIASARNTRGVAVGYNHIQKNQLTACGPFDLGSSNRDFSIFNEKSQFRTPKQMIDNTRHTHNEMVKDRIVIDKNGNIEKYKPDYAIWIEEDTIEERKEPGWQEKRDKDSQWIMTKKLAAQLGIPIVVIDREHYAQREMEKVDLLEKLITGEEIDKEKYRKYIEEFSNLSKAELVKELITKYENNRVGLQFNEKLWFKYFSQERFENIINDVFSNIENTISEKEKKEILMELSDVANKEETETENERAKSFYGSIKTKCKELTQTESTQETNNEQAQNNIELRKMLELYFEKGINYDDLNEQKRKLIKDMELVKQGERGQDQEVK